MSEDDNIIPNRGDPRNASSSQEDCSTIREVIEISLNPDGNLFVERFGSEAVIEREVQLRRRGIS